jgi:hypothetical protein
VSGNKLRKGTYKHRIQDEDHPGRGSRIFQTTSLPRKDVFPLSLSSLASPASLGLYLSAAYETMLFGRFARRFDSLENGCQVLSFS